jgi:electron transport complex protein RnfD
MANSPHILQPASVQRVMFKVLVALLPGIVAYAWFFGAAILLQLALASVTALAAEALLLKLRNKPVLLFLTDGSALVTAWLVALAFPPIAPWWLTVCGVLTAIVVAKHLYGGLGQNPFNPAMVAFCTMIVAFPQLMSQWPQVEAGNFTAQFNAIFGSLLGLERQVDAMVMATPLDALRAVLHNPEQQATIASIAANHPAFGLLGGRGWEWVAAGYLLGGLWLIQQRIITWHIPVAFIATLAIIAAVFNLFNPEQFASAHFHLLTGGAMLGAFFIATDPVSGSTTPLGKLIFAAGAALLTLVIRYFGAYPDGIAFGILLMNLVVPLIDMNTQPRVFGHKSPRGADTRPVSPDGKDKP